MAQIVYDKYLVGLQWEPLLGLEREAREVSRLIRRREANVSVIVEANFQMRVLGSGHLVAPAPAADTESSQARQLDQPRTLLALAAMIAATIDHASFLYVHALPGTQGVLLVGVRDKRVELDCVVPVTELASALQKFTQINATTNVVIMGDQEIAETTETLSWKDLSDRLSQLAGATYTIKHEKKRKPLSRRTWLIMAVSTFVFVVGTAVFVLWPEPPPPATPMSLPNTRRLMPTPEELLRSKWKEQLRNETQAGGPGQARFYLNTLKTLPVDRSGWLLRKVECDQQGCTVTRVRRPGTDVKTLLAAGKELILDDTLQVAQQHITPAPSEELGGVAPVANNAFQELVTSRMQALSDYGMVPTISASSPIIDVPAALKDKVDVPKRGAWQITGDLAFVDSIALLVIQSANMVWLTLDVDLTGEAPTFVAKGNYYVM